MYVCIYRKKHHVDSVRYYPSSQVSFPGGSDGKETALNAGDLGSIPGLGKSSGEGNGYPTPVFLPGEFHGPKSPMGYSPWSYKEPDMTE